MTELEKEKLKLTVNREIAIRKLRVLRHLYDAIRHDPSRYTNCGLNYSKIMRQTQNNIDAAAAMIARSDQLLAGGSSE